MKSNPRTTITAAHGQTFAKSASQPGSGLGGTGIAKLAMLAFLAVVFGV
jgi:hypothetical protein